MEEFVKKICVKDNMFTVCTLYNLPLFVEFNKDSL